MGVMSCNRKDCESLMCDTYIRFVGYVCGDCKSEFEDYLEDKGKTDITEGEMNKELEAFMETSKDNYDEGDKISVYDFFNKHSR